MELLKVTPSRVSILKRHRTVLITYLKAKLRAGDWHGVRDAAADIEMVEVRIHEHKRKVASERK